jgi:hypothetical protein
MVLGLGALAALDNIESLPIEANPRHYMALAVTILGVGLLVGSIVGRARWLIIVGLIMVPTLIFSPVFEFDWNTAEFDIFVEPVTFDELAASYEIEAGSIVIDLTELDWEGETVELMVSAGVGNIEVRVPEDVALSGDARANIGRVGGPDGTAFGFREPSLAFGRPGEAGHLVLDLELSVGNIEVVNR